MRKEEGGRKLAKGGGGGKEEEVYSIQTKVITALRRKTTAPATTSYGTPKEKER